MGQYDCLRETPININVLANDTLSSAKIIEITSGPSHGWAAVDLHGTPDDPADDFITYTPAAGYHGR